MKVLILHQHFKVPHRGGAIRSYYLSKALVDHGIETIVITAHNEPVFKTEIIEGIVIHYLPVPYDNRLDFISESNLFLSSVSKERAMLRGIKTWIFLMRYRYR